MKSRITMELNANKCIVYVQLKIFCIMYYFAFYIKNTLFLT